MNDSASGVRDFDARAATWDDDPDKRDRAIAVADAIVREARIPPTARALEYGAGTGLLSFVLRPKLGQIVLADISEGMLEVAARKVAAAGDARMRVQKLDLVADARPDERFDVVYSLMTLHHVPDTDAVMRAFHEVLAPGGTLVIADLDAEDGSFHGPEVDVHHGFDRDALGRRARDAGFARVRFVTAHTMRKNGRSYPIFLMVAERD